MPPLVYSPVFLIKSVFVLHSFIWLLTIQTGTWIELKFFSDKVSLDSGNVAYIMVWDSQEHFLKWKLPKCAIYQMATTRRLGKAMWGATVCNKGRTLRLGQSLEDAAWEIAHLELFHLVKYPWVVAIW